jgi:hypothetical protein
MPISTLEHDTLAKLFAICKSVQADLQPKLSQLDSIYNSAGGVTSTLTQAELDELPELSGLTKQTVDDGVFALTSGVLPALVNATAALSQLAARFL